MRRVLIRIGAVAALVYAALFYVVALASAAGLAWLGYLLGSQIFSFRGKGILLVAVVALALIAAGLVIVWSILPRWSRFIAPGPELDRAVEKRLFREIDRLAALTGQRPPTHVYLVPEVNAFVTERGGFMGLFSTRVMGLGLPLLSNLTIAQLRSVLAHEYGHFAGGDVKLLPWISKARVAMIQTLQNLAGAAESANGGEVAAAGLVFFLVKAPFSFCAKLYLRLTQGLSRAQEISADTLAISLCGSATHREALTKTRRAALAFGAYSSQDLEPLLAAGRVPPLVHGFQKFLEAPSVQRALDAPRELTATDPYDSHPSLEDRLSHASQLAVVAAKRHDDEEPAVNLLADVAACELALARFVTEREVERVSWTDSGAVLADGWRDEFRQVAPFFAGKTVAWLPRSADEQRTCLDERGLEARQTDDERLQAMMHRAMWITLAVTLVDAGFVVVNTPGESIRFSRGDSLVDLGAELERFFSPEGTRDAWLQLWNELGLADVTIEPPRPS